MHPTCKHCGAQLTAAPEQIAGELVVRCNACGSLNVVALAYFVLGLL